MRFCKIFYFLKLCIKNNRVMEKIGLRLDCLKLCSFVIRVLMKIDNSNRNVSMVVWVIFVFGIIFR